MEYLPNGYTLELAPGTFPLSTDSMVLSHFVRLPAKARVLDLGSGCGTLGLLLCARDSGCHVTGIERDEAAHNGAVENIRRNGLTDRMESICGDLRQQTKALPAGSFTTCVSNPPYFSSGPAAQLTAARREDHCTLEALIASASRSLKYGGDFYLVHRPERLGEILYQAGRHQLEGKRLCLVRHKEGGPVCLILLQLRKGGKPGLLWEEWTLHHSDGTPTQCYHDIYHTQEA